MIGGEWKRAGGIDKVPFWFGSGSKSLMLVPVPAIQLEELIHELSSDNVRENLSAATF